MPSHQKREGAADRKNQQRVVSEKAERDLVSKVPLLLLTKFSSLQFWHLTTLLLKFLIAPLYNYKNTSIIKYYQFIHQKASTFFISFFSLFFLSFSFSAFLKCLQSCPLSGCDQGVMEDLLFGEAKTTHNAPTWPHQTRGKTSEISKEGFPSCLSIKTILLKES